MDDTQAAATAGAMALGITEVLKSTGYLPSRFALAASVIVACATYFALAAHRGPVAIVYGLMAGLSASGLYSGVKAATEGTK